jgi:predicted negative regulator of RcsB-dependent stress response
VDEFLTDQQQADVVRKWLRENGGFLVLGLALGLGGLFGWTQWQEYQVRRAGEASRVYQQLVEAVLDSRTVRAAELEAELVANYSGSPYVDQGRLVMAKLHMDRNETDEAAGYLERLVADTRDAGMRQIARLRLARVRIQQQQYDAALAALTEIDENSAFSGRFHELRGDAYYAQGALDDARREYELALGTVQAGTLNRGLVQAKLDSLGASLVGPAEFPPEASAEPAPDDATPADMAAEGAAVDD